MASGRRKSEQYEALELVRGRVVLRGSADDVELEPGQILLGTRASPELHYSTDREVWSVLVPESILLDACSECGWLKPGECVRFNLCRAVQVEPRRAALGEPQGTSARQVVAASAADLLSDLRRRSASAPGSVDSSTTRP